MRIAPEPLIDAAKGIAEHYPTGRFTPGMLEKAWRFGKRFSTGLLSLAQERCERLGKRGLLREIPGPRGGIGYEFTDEARARWPEIFNDNGS